MINGKKVIISRKMAQMVNFSRNSHHPIETLSSAIVISRVTMKIVFSWYKRSRYNTISKLFSTVLVSGIRSPFR